MNLLFINSDQNNEYRQVNDKFGGVGYYRLWLPKLAIEEDSKWKVDFVSDLSPYIKGEDQESIAQSYVNLVKQYDAVVIKHFDNPNAGRFLSFACEYSKVPLITDLDDDVLAVREDQPAFSKGYAKGEIQRTTVGTMLSYSKGILCTSEYLGKKITGELKTIFNIDIPYFVLPNYCNPDEWKFPTKLNKNKVVIGWHGSLTHNADLKMVLPHVVKVMRENPNVYLELLGGVNKDFAVELFTPHTDIIDRIELIAGTKAWHNFPYHLCKQRWDIGIAPLIDDEFNRSKSNIKWLEYSLKGIPTIASDVEPYKTIEHGKTGFLVKDDWYEVLTELLNDKSKRKQIAQNAKKEVLKNWSYHKKGKMWRKAFTVLKSNKK